MSNLKIHSIENKGNLASECVWIDVLSDVENLSFHMICDTTYTNDKHISNELRHIYWFPAVKVKKGDWIKLMTKPGKASVAPNNRGGNTHTMYWNLGKTVWNKDGDSAVLFNINNWATTRA